jgi:hypothetical protein
MSASRLSLKNPIVIAVVVVLGIAVTILNIQTFGKGRLPSRRVQAGIHDGPALPGDLATLVRDMEGFGDYSGTGTRSESRPRLPRDPFLDPRFTGLEPVKAAPAEKIKLVCSSVMMGSKRSVAMINGTALGVGDRIDGFTVTTVDTRGAGLRNSAGKKIFLFVGNEDTGAESLKMEFKDKKTDNKTVMNVTERNLP